MPDFFLGCCGHCLVGMGGMGGGGGGGGWYCCPYCGGGYCGPRGGWPCGGWPCGGCGGP
ncbi:hypothetical protein ACFYUV_18165 [Nonomuraea sp. NPDC003560]|uniref:hypothetical protein n=1 Tax=Nonomuraea sp. NPDC003560 TaxID=3364341 RepID=UPI0036784569